MNEWWGVAITPHFFMQRLLVGGIKNAIKGIENCLGQWLTEEEEEVTGEIERYLKSYFGPQIMYGGYDESFPIR